MEILDFGGFTGSVTYKEGGEVSWRQSAYAVLILC